MCHTRSTTTVPAPRLTGVPHAVITGVGAVEDIHAVLAQVHWVVRRAARQVVGTPATHRLTTRHRVTVRVMPAPVRLQGGTASAHGRGTVHALDAAQHDSNPCNYSYYRPFPALSPGPGGVLYSRS